MIGYMRRITEGDYEFEVDGTDRKDEIGTIAGAVSVFRENGRQVAELTANYKGQADAIRLSQSVLELSLDGTITDANDIFCRIFGYTIDEIRGKPASMFADAAARESAEYRLMWDSLQRGEHVTGQYKRIGKGGREVWLEVSFNPILGLDGKPFKIVQIATDMTERRLQAADFEGQIAAISKAQGIIEFSLDGKVVSANENFLNMLGYTLSEIKGQHHSIFVDPTYRASVDYRMFWEKLGRGEHDTNQYKTIGKGGREVWIQASYNPILDMNGKPFKVVKYATDVTEQVRSAEALQAAVRESKEVIEAARGNDLTRRVPLDGKTGEIANLCEGINTLLDTMSTVVADMMGAATTISNAVAEISSGTTDLSQRTEQQASNLEETAASMEEMAATVKQNADNAQQANQLAASARGTATDGGEVVGKAVTAHEPHRNLVAEDLRHHFGDRRDRLPDQSPRPQRRRRGRAGRRCRQGLRRGRLRGALARPAPSARRGPPRTSRR